MDVAIIDYQMSNLHSVQAACTQAGLSSTITTDPKKILDSRAAILPGVGAFGKAMHNLTQSGLDNCIKNFVETGKPFIGICLGLQLLFEKSEEFGFFEGLGLIKGTVKKFCFREEKGVRFPVPQVGWNQIHQFSPWHDGLLRNNVNGDFMYFVHSFYVVPDEESIILASTTYGRQSYCSTIQQENIFATQFHPEKSGIVGLKVYQQLRNQICS